LRYQKAAKQQAARNTAILQRIHLASLIFNVLFIVLRFIVYRSSSTRSTYLLYFLLSTPAFVIEFWLEKIGRPRKGPNGELMSSGEDLEAKGLTEYMFDVLYWTFGTTFVASIFGDKAWWLWVAVPLYSAWLGYSTFGTVRQSMGMGGQGGSEEAPNGAMSNRQKKLEKRGGQKVQYR